MMGFDDGHEFQPHHLPSDCHKWWTGRLVKAKYPIFEGAFTRNKFGTETVKVQEGTVGVVVGVRADEGLLEIMWTTGEHSFVSFHDVLSQK